MYKTVFPNKENKIRETNKGQKEVWTAKKGLKNTVVRKIMILNIH